MANDMLPEPDNDEILSVISTNNNSTDPPIGLAIVGEKTNIEQSFISIHIGAILLKLLK